jgi:hypothetical protein
MRSSPYGSSRRSVAPAVPAQPQKSCGTGAAAIVECILIVFRFVFTLLLCILNNPAAKEQPPQLLLRRLLGLCLLH